MFLAAVRPVARAQVARQARALHFENKVDHALPFNVTNKPFLVAKMVVYTIAGFGLPFYAAHWHIQKSSGSD